MSVPENFLPGQLAYRKPGELSQHWGLLVPRSPMTLRFLTHRTYCLVQSYQKHIPYVTASWYTAYSAKNPGSHHQSKQEAKNYLYQQLREYLKKQEQNRSSKRPLSNAGP